MLEGIKVIELGTHIAIPNTGRMLADWGAEVIKVEPPRGEAWRYIGNGYGIPYSSDCNPIFQVPNANKKSIALNLKDPSGREIMMQLLKDADIFLTNTRPHALKKLGIDYETLKERFPRLIFVHFSAYGLEGPEKDKPGFDIAAFWAKAGMPLEWSSKECEPFRPLPGFGDSTVGFVNLAATMAALWNRQKTQKGEFVSTSLYSGALWFNNCGIACAQFQDAPYPRSMYENRTIYHMTYHTKDGDYFFFNPANWDKQYEGVLRYMGLEEYIGDPRFATLAGTRTSLKEIVPIFSAAFARMSTPEVTKMFIELDMVCQTITNPKNIMDDEQAWANGFLTKQTLENGREVVLPEPPVKFANAKTKEFHLAPLLGADSESILSDLGYSAESIKDLVEQGVIIA